MKRIDVAIAIVARGDQVLIARRRSTDPLGGFWEFPGGKCEPNESPADCLRREVQEELGIEVEPIQAFDPIEHDYPHAQIRLHPYLCRHVAGDPRPVACEAAQWISADQLPTYRFPPANDDLLRRIMQHFTGSPSDPA